MFGRALVQFLVSFARWAKGQVLGKPPIIQDGIIISKRFRRNAAQVARTPIDKCDSGRG